jgi:hypothetical protein
MPTRSCKHCGKALPLSEKRFCGTACRVASRKAKAVVDQPMEQPTFRLTSVFDGLSHREPTGLWRVRGSSGDPMNFVAATQAARALREASE